MIDHVPHFKPFASFDAAVPYRGVTNDVIVSENPDQLTAILEMHVSSVNDIEIMQYQHDKLMNLICDLPDNASVSVYFTKIFRDEVIPIRAQHSIPTVNYLEERRVRHLSGIRSPRFACYLAITLPMKSAASSGEFGILSRVFDRKPTSRDAERETSFKDTLAKLNHIINTVCSSLEGKVFRLGSEHIIQFLSLILNHEFLSVFSNISTIFKSDFFASKGPIFKTTAGGYIFYGGLYHTVLSLRNASKESKLPDISHAGLNMIFHHERLLDMPFTIHHAMIVPGIEAALFKAGIRRRMTGARNVLVEKTGLSFLSKTPEGIDPGELAQLIDDAMHTVKTTQHRFLDQQFQVHLWAPSIEELNQRCQDLDAIIGKTYKLKREKMNIKPAFFSLFPGNEAINPITSTLPSYNVADFMPIDMPRFCFPDKSQDFAYYHNTAHSLVRVSPFDKRADAWNFQVYGGTGSGKSFLVQDLLWQYMVYDPQIAIIDYGGPGAGSYKSLVLNLRGTYLEIGFDSEMEFSVNPFDGPFFKENGEPLEEKSTALLYTIERMATQGKDDSFSGPVMFHLNAALRDYYQKHNNNAGHTCNLNEFAQTHLKDHPGLLAAGRDLYKELFWFIGEGAEQGPYARFFRRTKEIKNKDICAFDLEGLRNHPRLKDVLVPTILDMISYQVLDPKNLERKKFIIMEEAHNALKGQTGTKSDTGDFMVNTYRTVRKLGGCIGMVTQSISDLEDSPFAKGIHVNTHFYYFVGNKHPHRPSDHPADNYTPLRNVSVGSWYGTNRLSDFDIQTILSSKSKRDFYLLTPFFSGLLRFYPCREFILAATTDADHKIILRRHMRRLGHEYVTPEVIQSAMPEFFAR